MKLSENWLREWVNPAISTDEVVKQLTMAGLEVDGVESVALEFQKVVVGKVLQVEPHPDADKLRICQVNVGQDAPLKIVCGAANVHAGMIAPTAIVGANLGDFKIKKAKLRGVESFGMLCSAKELGLAESSDGLMPLAGDAPIGEDIRDYLNLDDVTIDIDLTPNRGDCLSIAGIAREMGLLTRTLVEPIETKAIDATISDTFPVEIDDTRVCPRYIGRVIKNINPNATTPLWMQEKLRRCGLRSISPVVDITNYVLLELGQPMHAFDLDKLKGGIKVRMAQKGEKLTLLDEKEVKLDDKTLIIADHEKPLAMAGVMGGLNSAVTDATQTIFLESAFFTPEQLAGCARRYGLSTDSSHRFERGVDPYLQRKATERATALLLDIVGGEAGEIIEVADEATLPIKNTITLRKARVTRVLGKTLDDNDITEILTRLEMQVTQTETGWAVIPPSFRFDIAIEADLIEELARVHGYNNFPSTVPQGHLDMREQHDNDLMRLQAVLVQRDYQETITYSFVDPNLQEKVNPNIKGLALANPIASDMSVMRTSLWTGLLQALQYNQKRQQARIRLFETGLRFVPNGDELQQEPMLSGLIAGQRYSEQWADKTEKVDFFDIKGDIEALLQSANIDYQFTATTHPTLHPGQAAKITQGDTEIGIIGALHPNLIRELDVIAPVYLFELRLTPLLQQHVTHFKSISKYPSVRRDIALIVGQEVQASDILNSIKTTASDLLLEHFLFDVYEGQGIEENKKSLAIGLIFQDFSRNLTESEVDEELKRILDKLQQDFQAQLRL